MARISVGGGTGFIGQALVRALLGRGDTVTVLSRSEASVERVFGKRVGVALWQDEGRLARVVAEQDALVHLAGEQAVGQRWSDTVKARLIASRIGTTTQLVRAIERASTPPKVLVCGSAIGIYGSRPAHEAVDENSAKGHDFLAELAVAWESAALAARAFGVRVVNARMGIVLGQNGGALSEMVKPFKLYAGGPIGSGKQIVSWVHIDDVVAILIRALDDETLRGPINVTAPNPVSNAELASAIGKQLDRPSWLHAPALALKLRFGEGAEPLLGGQRVLPSVLERLGYNWKYPELPEALAEALGSSG